MIHLKIAASLMALSPLLIFTSQAIPLVLKPDAITGKDTEISPLLPSSPTDDDFIMVNYGSVVRSIGLIEFDLSAIPAGATINSAELSLYQFYNTFSGGTYGIFPVTSSWTEATTFDSAPTHNPSPASSLAFLGSPTPLYRNWNLTSLVSDWARGAIPNYGMWIEEIPQDGSGSAYLSSSDDIESHRPILTIDYSVAPASIPDAGSTLALLSLAITGLIVGSRGIQKAIV
jgi:hypothetical protein